MLSDLTSIPLKYKELLIFSFINNFFSVSVNSVFSFISFKSTFISFPLTLKVASSSPKKLFKSTVTLPCSFFEKVYIDIVFPAASVSLSPVFPNVRKTFPERSLLENFA